MREIAKSIATEWSVIRREPYRLFFPLGILFGLAGTGHWLIYSTGLSGSYSGYYHATTQIWLYMGSFVAGFLMTAIPRFASAENAKSSEILTLLFLMGFIFISLVSRQWPIAGGLYITWLTAMLMFIIRRFRRRGSSVNPPIEFIWIPVAFLHGICGMLTVVLSQLGLIKPEFLEAGRSMSEQGFLLSLVVGIGGFLGPRLMGQYEMPSHEMIKKLPSLNKRRLFMHLGAASLLFISFWMEGAQESPAAYFLRAIIVTVELAYVSKVLAPPKIVALFQRGLSLSFWLIIVGVWAAAIFPRHHVAMLHILFLGGFGLLTFFISTMVVLSHSGHGEQMRRSLWIFHVILLGILLSLAIRLSAQFFPEFYFQLLGIASAVWIATGIAWLVFSAPFLLRIPGENAHAC